MNLSGFSAAYPGYQAAQTTDIENQKNQTAANEAATKMLGAQVLGRAFTNGQQTPMAPAPGQPSVPAGPPGAPIQNPPMPAQGQAGAPPAQGGSGMPEISLQAITQRILQTSPGIQNHPEVLLAALERAAPILDRQSKQDLAELRQEFQAKALGVREAAAATREAGLNDRAGRRGDQADRRLDQGDTREARLRVNASIRQDQGYQRLENEKTRLAQRAVESGDKNALTAWRNKVIEKNNYARALLGSASINVNLAPEDKKALLDGLDSADDDEIAAMRSQFGRTTPPAAPAAVPAPVTATPAAPIKVNTPAEAAALTPGTPYVTPDGKSYTR